MIQSSNVFRKVRTASFLVALSATFVGCGAAEDPSGYAEADAPDQELVASAEQELTAECTSAPYDKFVSITPDCQGCNPGEGRYVVSSSLLTPNYSTTTPCRPNYILQVGGSQRTFNFRAFWEDKVPTQADVPAGSTLLNVCKALKITVAGNYLGADLPTRTVTGTVVSGVCKPPVVDFNFTHTILSGLPGEFFAHARFLISAETAITKGKAFAVHLCRGAFGCN